MRGILFLYPVNRVNMSQLQNHKYQIHYCKAIFEPGTDTGETPQAEGDSRPGLWKLLIVSGTRMRGHQRLKLETVGFKGKASIRKSSYCL